MVKSWDVETPYNGSHKIEIGKSCLVVTRYFTKYKKVVVREETPEVKYGGYRDATKMVISEKVEHIEDGEIIVDTNIIPLRSIRRVHVQNAPNAVSEEYRQAEVLAMLEKSNTNILIYYDEKQYHVAKRSTFDAAKIAAAIVEAMDNLG